MARLLLIDDDHDMSNIVCESLRFAEHEVDYADRGSAAKELLGGGSYDLLIVDWDLPDLSGIELCKTLRSAGDTTPILMLTGHRHIEDKEAGFDAGVDDYLTKPFEMKELSVRVKALLRRAAISVGDVTAVATGAPSGPIAVGQVIGGKYRLDEFIDEGGMALVYKATHIAMDKPVVVKLVRTYLAKNEKIQQRFEQECRIMARINHPNVAIAFDTGMLDGSQPYLVMEYLKGESLEDRLLREGALPIDVALNILIQVCRGLEEAHGAGIVHRDLKPANIMLQEKSERSDWVKIVDFGLAHLKESSKRLTETGTIMGSAGYMSPEQLRGLPIDYRADIYSLGMILFEMLTDALPFKAPNTEAFYLKQLMEMPEPLSSKCSAIAPGSKIDLIVQRAIEKERDRRFQTVSELRLELEDALTNLRAD